MHRTVLTKSQLYLESHVGQLTDPYTASLAAYSLTQLNSHTAEIAVRAVSDFAIKRGESPSFFPNLEREIIFRLLTTR